jgi:hypothetical protein
MLKAVYYQLCRLVLIARGVIIFGKKEMMLMKKFRFYYLASILLALAFLINLGHVQARPVQQAAYQTPTPNEQGQIFYLVQEGDTCTGYSC